MKKIMLVSLVAVMMMSFTACMDKYEVKDEVTFKTYIEDVTPEETEVTTEETTVVSETTTVASEETDNAEEKTSVSNFVANGCSVKIDESKWLDASAYIETMKSTEGETAELKALEQKLKTTCDGAYYHKDLSGANFTIASAEVGEQASQMDLSDNIISGMLARALEKELTNTGMTFVGASTENYNGTPSLVITVDSPASMTGTVDMRAQMCIFYEGTYQYAITYTAAKQDFDNTKPDFNKVMNSIIFK